MKNLLKIVLGIMLTVSVSSASAFDKDIKYRSVKAHMSSEKPLTTGMNTFKLKILKDNKDIKDAKVSVKVFMPAMPGMPAMKYQSDAKRLSDGSYEVSLNIAMNGTWQIHIFVQPKTGKKYRVKTSINF